VLPEDGELVVVKIFDSSRVTVDGMFTLSCFYSLKVCLVARVEVVIIRLAYSLHTTTLQDLEL